MTPGDEYCPPLSSPFEIYIRSLGEGVQLHCKLYLNSIPVNTVIDPGAGVSVLDSSFTHNVDPVTESFNVVTANGNPLRLIGQITPGLESVVCILEWTKIGLVQTPG